MNNILLHIENKNNLRIALTQKKEYLYIKGYLCTKQCPDCPLHKIGEELERLDVYCKELSQKDMIVEMKIKFNVSENIIFN